MHLKEYKSKRKKNIVVTDTYVRNPYCYGKPIYVTKYIGRHCAIVQQRVPFGAPNQMFSFERDLSHNTINSLKVVGMYSVDQWRVYRGVGFCRV